MNFLSVLPCLGNNMNAKLLGLAWSGCCFFFFFLRYAALLQCLKQFNILASQLARNNTNCIAQQFFKHSIIVLRCLFITYKKNKQRRLKNVLDCKLNATKIVIMAIILVILVTRLQCIYFHFHDSDSHYVCQYIYIRPRFLIIVCKLSLCPSLIFITLARTGSQNLVSSKPFFRCNA